MTPTEELTSTARLKIIARMAALAVLVAAGGAKAHSWYPWECCSGDDCDAITANRVKIVADGYLVDGKFKVPTKEVRRSPDENYHACFPQPENLRCFFAPPFGS